MLILNKFLTQQDSISYADDPVFFSDKEFTITDIPGDGIELNKEKSRWVKRNGKWEHPLKFLGLEFDGKELRAKTRNGATLRATGDERAMLEAITEWEEQEGLIDCSISKGVPSKSKYKVLNSWKKILSGRLAGGLQSTFYNNKWDRTVEQDFNFKFGTSSWLGLIPGKHPEGSTFTVSSYANASLLLTLRGKNRVGKIRITKVNWPRGRPRKGFNANQQMKPSQ